MIKIEKIRATRNASGEIEHKVEGSSNYDYSLGFGRAMIHTMNHIEGRTNTDDNYVYYEASQVEDSNVQS